MSIKATNQFVFNLLNNATEDDVEVWQGIQPKNDDDEIVEPVVVFQRQTTEENILLDNASAPRSITYNVVIVNETAEKVTDIEDAILHAIRRQDEPVDVGGGQDLPPQGEDKGFARLIAIRVPMQLETE